MKKILIFGIVLLFIGMGIIPPTGGIEEVSKNFSENVTRYASDQSHLYSEDSEYWALLIGAGVYAGHPEEDRQSMITDVENLRGKLLISEHWKEENIKVIKGRDATLFNIIRGFKWLNKREDKNDFSLIYITTHGGPLSRDIFPWDEEDGCDEILATHLSFKYPMLHIRDDFLNLLLSLLSSKGVCVIIDSCYAGGFNDPPYFKTSMIENRMNADEWMHEFAEDLRASGRIVLMSCSENEISYVQAFSGCFINALTGYADTNEDDLVSAEEAFVYVEENINPSYNQHPTIYDDYPGELQLTEVELPPSKPEIPVGQVVGDTNTSYNYSTVSTDPEGGKISYGWDWDGNYNVDEWTDPVDSGVWVNTSHSWEKEGTYNLRVIAKDERGLTSSWSDLVVMMCSYNIPDQKQTIIDKGSLFSDIWLAQSFAPSLNILSKVELVCSSYGPGDPKSIHFYIRESLSGDNLADFSRVIPDRTDWHTFNFEDLEVIPGKTYYIVCKGEEYWNYVWRWKEDDPYPLGESFWSMDGNDWHKHQPPMDFCFVTWGKK